MKHYFIFIISFVFTFPLITKAQETLQNNGNMQMHAGSQMSCFGDFTNNGTFNNNLGTFIFAGTALQTISGTDDIAFTDITINNGADVKLDLEMQVAGNLTFTNGKLLTDRSDIASEFVHFLHGSTYSGVNDDRHVDGVIRKTGNTSFSFPVGNGTDLQMVRISAPDLSTDNFTAYYTRSDPDTDYSTLLFDNTCIDHLSRCEYWILDRTGGTADVEVGLDYDVNSCGVDVLCDLLVSRWDGAEWVSEGNGGVAGTLSSGTITSGLGCGSCGAASDVTSFSPFTLASFSPNNPLPISLLSFDATSDYENVRLDWITSSEINNAYFTIEKTKDQSNWVFVKDVTGAGNSSTTIDYKEWDTNPYLGVSYYRLKQTDFNGDYTYSETKLVKFESVAEYTVYPNPANTFFTLGFEQGKTFDLSLYNAEGKRIQLDIITAGDLFNTYDVSKIQKGNYYLKIIDGQHTTEKKIIIQ